MHTNTHTRVNKYFQLVLFSTDRSYKILETRFRTAADTYIEQIQRCAYVIYLCVWGGGGDKSQLIKITN